MCKRERLERLTLTSRLIRINNALTAKQTHNLWVVAQGGFHGRTMGAMALTTSKTIYRQGFAPLMPAVRPLAAAPRVSALARVSVHHVHRPAGLLCGPRKARGWAGAASFAQTAS